MLLAKRYRVRCIALEAPKTHRQQLDAYLRGHVRLSNLQLVTPPRPHDGRTGSWLAPVLRYAKRQQMEVQLIDAVSTAPNRREQILARRLRGIHTRPLLFICGEMHATANVVTLPALARLAFALLGRDRRGLTSTITPVALRLRKCVAYRLVSRHGGYQYNFVLRRVPPCNVMLANNHCVRISCGSLRGA